MNYIITNEQYYKDIATSIRERLKVDREYYPKDMATAIHLIPSSADGSNELFLDIISMPQMKTVTLQNVK